jgi:hypothetical protein
LCPFRHRRLLADAPLEVRVRALQPLGEPAGDPLDLGAQLLVDPQRQPGSPSDELHRPVVVGRAESAGDDAQVGAQPFRERGLELVLSVPHDRDQRRLETEPDELARDERSVAIVSVSPDELATCDDDDATQTRRCHAR